MEKSTLRPEALTVETFQPGAEATSAMIGPAQCTGCPSGCGIFPENP